MAETAEVVGPVDFKKGDTVTFAKGTTGNQASGWFNTKQFKKGDTAKVTAVRKNLLTVSTKYQGSETSFNVDREALETPNGEKFVPGVTTTRKIGEVPEGGIAANDPRIAWIFDDAARVAKNWGYCSTYDDLADRIGAPGRLRDLTVTTTINGLKVSATVKARSTKEAEEILATKVAGTK